MITVLVKLEQARTRIKPIASILVEAHEAAASQWRSLVEEMPGFAAVLDARARASCFHSHVSSEIEQRVAGRTDAVVNDRLGFFALWLPPDVLLRVKYVGNSDRAPHNYPTERQRLLARQRYDSDMIELLGVEAAPTLLTCGYTLDGLDLATVEIRCDCIGHAPWSFSIYGDGLAIEPLVFDGMADDTKPARVASRKKQRKDDEQAELG